MTRFRTVLTAIALSLAAIAPATAQDLTRSEFESLAHEGDLKAQNFLCLYYRGIGGGTLDLRKSLYWCDQAARKGSPIAQNQMAIKYENGMGVSQNRALMYMWWHIAQMEMRWVIHSIRSAEEYMTPAEISEGKKLATICLSSGFQLCGPKPPTVVSRPEPPSERQSPPTNPAPDGTKPVLIGAGSSFTISQQGHLLTNQHVVDGCQIVTIHLPSGLKKALVVATDDTNDLALLKTDLEDDNFIPISGTNVSLLEDVVVAGYPLSGSLSTTVKVTKGVVSSLAGLGNDYSQIQIDAAIQPGNSGGPILNDQGNVVAVTVAALNKEYFLKEQGTIPENTNFGIKSSTARAFVDANGVKLPQPYSRAMSRRDMADLITKTTHLVGCWVSRATAQKMASDQKQELSVTPRMQRQVEALR